MGIADIFYMFCLSFPTFCTVPNTVQIYPEEVVSDNYVATVEKQGVLKRTHEDGSFVYSVPAKVEVKNISSQKMLFKFYEIIFKNENGSFSRYYPKSIVGPGNPLISINPNSSTGVSLYIIIKRSDEKIKFEGIQKK